MLPRYEAGEHTAHEAFHLATAGGAEALGLGGEVGDLAPGKLFDALLIDADVDDAPFDVFYDGDDAADGDAADDDDDDAAPRKRARREADADARATAAAARARVLDLFERFLFLGDDRNIQRVYVGGRVVVARDGSSTANGE